jgi:hypothetical protein
VMEPFGGTSGGSKGRGSDMRQVWTLRNDIASEELAVYVAFAQVLVDHDRAIGDSQVD